MKKKYVVEYDLNACIGAASCVTADPDHWRFVANLNKSELLGSKKKTKGTGKNLVVVKETLEITESELPAVKAAAVACPANAIQIKEKSTGKQII